MVETFEEGYDLNTPIYVIPAPLPLELRTIRLLSEDAAVVRLLSLPKYRLFSFLTVKRIITSGQGFQVYLSLSELNPREIKSIIFHRHICK